MSFFGTIFSLSAISCSNKIGNQPEAVQENVINIRAEKSSGIVSLPAPDPAELTTRRLISLPEFKKYCHVAADSNKFRWIGASNRMFPWVGKNDITSIFEDKTPIPPRIPAPNRRAMLMIFELSNGRYLSLMPLSGEASVSWLETTSDKKLMVDYGTLGTDPVPGNAEVPLIAWAVSDNVYGSIAQIWKDVTASKLYQGKASLREEKNYPEAMKYLGWCTWEQYHKGISEEVMTNAFDRIEASDIPVRWVLIDDGHQTAKEGNRMVSMQPNGDKFPNGWQPIIARKKEDKVKWIGIWHTLLMHWGGVSPEHEMPNLAPYLMPQPVKNISKLPKDNQYLSESSASTNVLIPKDNRADSEKFYMEFMKMVKDFGFDFIKTDNVSRSTIEYYGTANAARAQKNNVLSLEKACTEHQLGLMNCSAQNTIGMLNATSSATMRTSPDYQKHNIATSKSQILQSVFNVVWLGQTLWPDHDMFHSSDMEVGETMSVTKALSGGPIYLSDDPADFNSDVILPLCYQDGLLIRPEAPGVPLPNSLFNDALYESEDVYKTISPLKNKACAIAAYNLSVTAGKPLKGTITEDDYTHASAMIQPFEGSWDVPKEGLVIYDWKEQKGEKIDNKGLDFKIEGFGHKLFLLCPIRDQWAIIGRSDKYLSPSTVDILDTSARQVTIQLRESGPIALYSGAGYPVSKHMKFTEKGNGIYLGQPIGKLPNDVVIKVYVN